MPRGCLRMFVDDFPLAAGTDMVFDGEIGWANDSIIFNHFEISLDKKTKMILEGFAIYGDSLEQTNIDILTFKSTLFELQRLFDVQKIENQIDIDIASQFSLTGNLTQFNVIGSADLNKNKIELNASYAQSVNNGMVVQLNLSYNAGIITKIPCPLPSKELKKASENLAL